MPASEAVLRRAREDRAQIGLVGLPDVVGAKRVAHRRGDHRIDVAGAQLAGAKAGLEADLA